MADIDFYYPFDSVGGDRKTTAATERRFYAAMFTDGVVGDGGFQISQTGAGVFTIGAGVCIICGAVGGIVNAKSIECKPGAGVSKYIALRLDTTATVRSVSLVAVDALESDTQEQIESGGVRDIALYKVTGQAGGGYGLLDERRYCQSFDNAQYSDVFAALLMRMESEGAAKIDALAQQFAAEVEAAKTASAGAYGSAGRQGFINPCFQVNQRGQETYSIASGAGYTFDRWLNRIGGGSVSEAVKVSSVIDGARVALKIENQPYSSGVDIAASAISQEIERGVSTFCAGGRKFTVSFDAKADALTRIAVEPVQFLQVQGAGVPITAQVVEVGTEWKRYSLTFTGTETPVDPSLTDALKVAFFYSWKGYAERFGSNSNEQRTFYFANMQVNEGAEAMPLMVKPYAEELEACQRYYVQLGNVSLSVGALLANSNQVITCPLPITRRLAKFPSVTTKDRSSVSGCASVEVAAGGWRNGLPCVISSNSQDAPVFVVTNTDSSAVTRVCFNGVSIDAEFMD